MQSLIANMLRLYRFDNIEDIEAADRLLQVLEQEGMLPPFNDWLYHMDGDKADSENIRYLSWEPEDEEK
jgi:hypothetical protein